MFLFEIPIILPSGIKIELLGDVKYFVMRTFCEQSGYLYKVEECLLIITLFICKILVVCLHHACTLYF